jgi:hypothetical protein
VAVRGIFIEQAYDQTRRPVDDRHDENENSARKQYGIDRTSGSIEVVDMFENVECGHRIEALRKGKVPDVGPAVTDAGRFQPVLSQHIMRRIGTEASPRRGKRAEQQPRAAPGVKYLR